MPGEDDDLTPEELEALEQPYPEYKVEPAEVFLQRDLPEPEWLLAPYLLRESATILAGAPGSGKTLWALYATCQIAKAGGMVLLVENEGSPGAFQKRLRRAAAAVGGIPDSSVSILLRPPLNLTLGGDVAKLVNTARAYDLVVLDSLASLSVGVDENSAKEMGHVVEAVDRLKCEAGCAVLCLHHTTKSDWKPGEVPSLGSERGSGVLAGRADAILVAKAMPRVPGYVDFTLYTTKQRDGEPATPKQVRINMMGDVADVTFEERLVSTIEYDTPLRKRVSAIAQQVLKQVPRPPMSASRNELQDIIKCRRIDLQKAVGELIDAGEVGELSNGSIQKIVKVQRNAETREEDD